MRDILAQNFDILLSDLQINYVGFIFEQMDDKIADDFTLTFNSIQLICDGVGWFKLDDKMYFPEKEYINLLPANTVQSYGPINPNYIQKYICHFTAEIGKQNLFNLIDFKPSVKVNDYKYALQTFYHLERINFKEDMISVLTKKELILRLLNVFFNSQGDDLTYNNFADNIIYKVASYINDNMDKNITVSDLAELMGYNTNYFTTLFKSHTNTTPKQYIIDVKLKRAMALLQGTSYSMQEIADMTGFINQYYFSTSFKKNYGLSPSRYRDVVFKRE